MKVGLYMYLFFQAIRIVQVSLGQSSTYIGYYTGNNLVI